MEIVIICKQFLHTFQFFNCYKILSKHIIYERIYFVIDDISFLPYLKEKDGNNFYCEINNKETFERVLEIYNCNEKKFDIYFSFLSSGLAIIQKKTNENLNLRLPINSRSSSFKNFLRLLWKKIKN